MSRSKWFLAAAVALSLGIIGVTARSTDAKKEPPPPAAPRIVGYGNAHAVDSNGNLYRVDRRVSEPCMSVLDGGFVGNLFGGAPPSPVMGVSGMNGARGSVVLQNGDVYYWCTDTDPLNGHSVYAGNIFTTFGVPPAVASVPDKAPESRLGQSRPNPTGGAAQFQYTTATAGTVRVRIFDASGRLVRTLQAEHGTPGRYALTWDGSSDSGQRVANGTYFAKVRMSDGTEAATKVVIAR